MLYIRSPMWRCLAAVSLLVWLGSTVACTAPKSRVCRDVCAREAECHESRPTEDQTFDEGECVAACAALERDAQARGLVTNYAACVSKAGRDCAQVLECK